MSMASVALARRREQERVLLERQSFLKDNARADCAAKWEKRSSDKIGKRDILTRIQKLAEQDDEQMEEKRNRIRILYDKDMIEWKEMVSSLQSKMIEERELTLRDKALKLKEKREQERLGLAKACYERRWRESSDQARCLVAQNMSDRLMNDRKNAIDFHAENQSSHDFQQRDEVDKRSRIQEERNIQEKLNRQLKNVEIRSALDQQVADLKLKGEIESKKKIDDERALLEKWKFDDEEKRNQDLESLTVARNHGTQTLLSNVDRLKKRNEAKKMDEERDKLLLQYSVEKETRQLENEKNHKLNQKDACKGYILTLQEQMMKDQEDLELTEKYRINVAEEMFNKRDVELKNQHDDRKQIMVEINKTRKEQIHEKGRLMKEENAASVNYNKETLAQLDRQSQYEEEQRRKKQEATRQAMLYNKELAQMKAAQRLKEKQEKYKSSADLEREEEQEKLDHLANKLYSNSR